jgi:hypothetical protein
MDKFAWHLPVYRQHQRPAAAGIRVSRPWPTQLAQAAISLLVPIYEAQFASIRSSRVKAMDETPVKAGRSGHGKMHTCYFWPIYGQLDEVCFLFHASRSADFVCQALGDQAARQCRVVDRRQCRLRTIRREDRDRSRPMLGSWTPRLPRRVDSGTHRRRRSVGANHLVHRSPAIIVGRREARTSVGRGSFHARLRASGYPVSGLL